MRVFLAAPFTAMVETVDGRTLLALPFADLLATLLATLRARGCTVTSSHERERWGADIYAPERALAADLEQIRLADLLVALIGDPPSPGVQMELGHALAFSKPIAAFHTQPFERLPHLTKGMASRAEVTITRYDSAEELVNLVGQMALPGAAPSL